MYVGIAAEKFILGVGAIGLEHSLVLTVDTKIETDIQLDIDIEIEMNRDINVRLAVDTKTSAALSSYQEGLLYCNGEELA